MADKFDNKPSDSKRDTMYELGKSWDSLLSDFRKADDIDITSLADLGLDNEPDFSTLKDASDPTINLSARPGTSDVTSSTIRIENPRSAHSASTYEASPADGSGVGAGAWDSETYSQAHAGSDISDPSDLSDLNDILDDAVLNSADAGYGSLQGAADADYLSWDNSPLVSSSQGQPVTDPSWDNSPIFATPQDATAENITAKSSKDNKGEKKPMGKKILKLILILILLMVIGVIAFVGYVILTSPKIYPENLYDNLNQSSTIYDDEGNVLESVSTEQVRTNISYSDMPDNLINAFVAVEDKTFFSHHGFNVVRIFGAIKDSLFSGGRVGGTSTITQQLARNLYLTGDRTMTRKVREAYYTIILERSLEKEQIIEAYLNTINLGFGTYGVQAASQAYFGCDVSDLTLAQCSVLACIPKAPSTYAPLKRLATEDVETENPNIIAQDSTYTIVYNDAYKDRQRIVLNFMKEQGYITESEYLEALAEDIKSEMNTNSLAQANISSYFADYCIDEVMADLQSEMKLSKEEAQDLVYSKGIKIYSTLNVSMQKAAEEEFANSSNFPSVTGLVKNKNGDILSDDKTKILLYNKSTYFSDDGSFVLSADEYKKVPGGDLVIYKGKRLNIYEVKGSNGDSVPQIEFKNLYTMKDGLFYSISGGYISGIDEKYLSRDSDGNVVISADFFYDYPDYFTMGDTTVSISPTHYTLRQETIQPQGAMVVTDFTNGQIKVMVGGRSLSGRLLYNRANNTRQPGSSIKPLSVYGPALQSGVDNDTGWTAGSTIEDSENIVDGKVWPKNSYSGYKGWVTLRTCVEQSINVCSVRLLQDIGLSYGLQFLEANGITSVVTSGEPNDMNLAALALGGMTNGISPIEMASAYGTFPNKGVHVEATSYTKVEDAQGNVLLQKNPYTKKVFDESVAFIMTDILRTTVTHGIAGRAAIGTQPVGGKTGTTTDNVDAWFCGFTPQFSAAVWIGNDVNIELSKGSSAAAGLWSKVMKRVCEGYSYGSFPSQPSNVYVENGEYYVDGTSRTGPLLGSSDDEILYDDDGRPYIIDSETGQKAYVTLDDDGNIISTEPVDETDEGDDTETGDTSNGGTHSGGDNNTTPSDGGNIGNGGSTDHQNSGGTTENGGGTSTTPNPSPPHGVVNDAE